MATHDSTPKEFVVLHATDVHCAIDKVQKLQKWLKEKQQRVDVVLISGDITNMPMDPQLPEEEVRKHNSDLEEVLASFAPLSRPLYYIPGNHDAITQYHQKSPHEHHTPENNPAEKPVPQPCNVHMRAVPIAEKLSLIGLGGSVPGYQNGKQVWNSFPYQSDKEMGEDLHSLLDPIFFSGAQESISQSTVILMTHNGPTESDTALARVNPRAPPVVSGCSVLHELLCREELQKSVVINIHGHTHDAPGRSTLGKVTVLNPGALLFGCFGVYTLRSMPQGPQAWQLASVCFHRLSD